MPESMPVSVCVRELTKRYGTVEAVRRVSFDVAAGEIFGLLGAQRRGQDHDAGVHSRAAPPGRRHGHDRRLR
jgi:ABC-type phosphonate transport system ATPase subunit